MFIKPTDIIIRTADRVRHVVRPLRTFAHGDAVPTVADAPDPSEVYLDPTVAALYLVLERRESINPDDPHGPRPLKIVAVTWPPLPDIFVAAGLTNTNAVRCDRDEATANQDARWN